MSVQHFLQPGAVPTSQTRLLLSNLVKISPIAIGTWSWGDKSTWGWNEESDSKANDAFAESLKKGIGFFDTAEVYGKGESERCIARYMKNHANLISEESGNDFVIATKFLPLPYLLFYPTCLLQHLKDSLERLEVKQVDLYQIHGPIHLRSIETLADALAEAVKQGLTKTVGVSNYSTEQVIRMYDALQKHGIQLASNQIEYSLLRRVPETSGLIKACLDRGIAVLAYSPLGMGRLTGKYSVQNPPPSGRRFSDYNMELIEPVLNVMRSIAEARNVSVSSVALNWVMCKGAIPLAGAKNGEQAIANAQALGWRLSDEEIEKLDQKSIAGSNGWFWQHG
ncbi:oxidoreductase [Acrasis kona]|uniref:Oxidoreductase n=1 Tax=Acrasis kona TaxID=1008807 RepID=A0AAW2ZPV7_9EUKA